MRLALCLLLTACVDVTVRPLDSRVDALCSYVADCVGVYTHGVDWRDPDECAAAVVDVEACEAAWLEVPCLPATGRTVEDAVKAARAVERAVEACL